MHEECTNKCETSSVKWWHAHGPSSPTPIYLSSIFLDQQVSVAVAPHTPFVWTRPELSHFSNCFHTSPIAFTLLQFNIFQKHGEVRRGDCDLENWGSEYLKLDIPPKRGPVGLHRQVSVEKCEGLCQGKKCGLCDPTIQSSPLGTLVQFYDTVLVILLVLFKQLEE